MDKFENAGIDVDEASPRYENPEIQAAYERFAHASKRQLIAAVRSGREMHGWPIIFG